MTNSPVIQVHHISKTFGALRAVNGLSFEVPEKNCFGFLGPNGAGKTTMMKMLYARVRRDTNPESSISIFGYDPSHQELSIKYLCGVVPQEDNLDEELNVIQNLMLFARFYNMPNPQARERAEELLGFLELTDKRTARIRDLSGGMKRRLVIARALLNQPRLLILDEPTTGLDPQVRHIIWDKLRQLKKQGTTLLLSTHYMEQAFAICDTILIMHQGQKVLLDTPKALLADHIEDFVLELTENETDPDQLRNHIPETVRIDPSGHGVRFYADDIDALKSVADTLPVGHCFLRQSNLEDVFLKTTGRTLNDKQ
ncbi:MAG: ABC transporter ATP-binding protein [Planctomycetota bacterium]|jgi:lipooligosaccharide transport system ATP-binding protein